MIDNPELGYTPNNLKALRAKYGLTQAQVVKMAGATGGRHVAYRWETGEREMSYSTWRMLLQNLQQTEEKTQKTLDV